MVTVTVSRQMGSLGSQIAFSLSELLGYRLVWRELINQAARQAGAPDTALAAIDDLGLLGICPSPQDCMAYRRELEIIMNELASKGQVIILGRGGQVVLRGRPDVLHVRIIAPAELRAQRIADRTEVPLDCALAQIKTSDQNRRKYLRRFYQAQLEDPQLYHLTINTEHLNIGQATQIIARAIETFGL